MPSTATDTAARPQSRPRTPRTATPRPEPTLLGPPSPRLRPDPRCARYFDALPPIRAATPSSPADTPPSQTDRPSPPGPGTGFPGLPRLPARSPLQLGPDGLRLGPPPAVMPAGHQAGLAMRSDGVIGLGVHTPAARAHLGLRPQGDALPSLHAGFAVQRHQIDAQVDPSDGSFALSGAHRPPGRAPSVRWNVGAQPAQRSLQASLGIGARLAPDPQRLAAPVAALAAGGPIGLPPSPAQMGHIGALAAPIGAALASDPGGAGAEFSLTHSPAGTAVGARVGGRF